MIQTREIHCSAIGHCSKGSKRATESRRYRSGIDRRWPGASAISGASNTAATYGPHRGGHVGN